MSVRTFSRVAPRAIPRPELRLAGKVTVAFLVLLGLGALGGGIALVAKPDGSIMQFPVDPAGSPRSSRRTLPEGNDQAGPWRARPHRSP